MTDYRTYRFSIKEYGIYLLQSIAVVAVISYLFYHSWFAMILLVVFYPFYLKMKAEILLQKQREVMQEQFRETISAVASALNAGYSIENAWREAKKEVEKLYGKQAILVKELNYMLAHLELKVPLESLLYDFAWRSGMEDVHSFCQVFLFAKRSGGDFIGIIRATSERIGRKVDLQRELNSDLAARRLESRVMNLMPMFLLLYLNITSPGYFDRFYGNLSGVVIMSICLFLYALAYRWSEKMLQSIQL